MARIVFAVAQCRTLPQGPLTVLDDQDHDVDMGGHVLKVRDQSGVTSWVLGADVTPTLPTVPVVA